MSELEFFTFIYVRSLKLTPTVTTNLRPGILLKIWDDGLTVGD